MKAPNISDCLGSVMSNGSFGFAVFNHASSAITTIAASFAMHRRRAVLAKASFSHSSTNDGGINIIGPSGPMRNNVGPILPLFRMQNSA